MEMPPLLEHQVLLIEHSESDAALIKDEFDHAEIPMRITQVSDFDGIPDLLLKKNWDVILCDYTMPQFNALDVLKILQDNKLDIPFIIIADSTGEQDAVQAMKIGANDYILKDHLVRLVPSIEREIQARQERKARKAAEAEMAETQSRYKRMVENVKDYGIFMLDTQGIVINWNLGAARLTGYHAVEVIGKPLSLFFTDEDMQQGMPYTLLKAALEIGKNEPEMMCCHRDRPPFYAHMSISTVYNQQGDHSGYCIVIRDITDRKLYQMELEKRVHQLDILSSFGYRALDGLDNIREAINETLILIIETLSVDTVVLFELMADQSTLQCRAEYGVPAIASLKYRQIVIEPVSQFWHTLQTKKAVVVENMLEDKAILPDWNEICLEMCSCISVPVLGAEEPYGIICAYTKKPSRFSQMDTHFLQSLANLLALVIERIKTEARQHDNRALPALKLISTNS